MAKPCMKIVVTLRIDNAHQIFSEGNDLFQNPAGRSYMSAVAAGCWGKVAAGCRSSKGRSFAGESVLAYLPTIAVNAHERLG